MIAGKNAKMLVILARFSPSPIDLLLIMTIVFFYSFHGIAFFSRGNIFLGRLRPIYENRRHPWSRLVDC